MRLLFIILASIVSFSGFSQKEQCIRNFLKDRNVLVEQYNVYNIDSLDYDAIPLNELLEIKKTYTNNKSIKAINCIKDDSLFNKFINTYVYSERTTGLTTDDFASVYGYSYNRKDYYLSLNYLNRITDTLINQSKIIHVSIFYFNEELDSDIYLYERGYFYDGMFEFVFKEIYNPIIESPIYPYVDQIETSSLKNIGIEIREYTYRIVLPILFNQNVLNIELIVCIN